MSDENTLPPHIDDALSRVPPVSADLRDAHIAAAISAMPTKRRRLSPLAVAAAVLLLLGVGSTLATRKGASPQNVVTAHAIKVIQIPKNMAPDATIPGFPHSCYLADTETVALYTMDTQPMQVDVTDGRVAFKNNNSCATAAYINFPSTVPTLKDPVDCANPPAADETLLGSFTMTGIKYRVLATSTNLILFSCAQNAEVGRTPHPDYDNVID